MFITELEFYSLTKKFNLQWKPVEDSEISPNKRYIISDKQFVFGGKDINVLELINEKYRRVATRLAHKGKPYLNFDVASPSKKQKQKAILLHRARLRAFIGDDPDNPIARHGSLGQHNNDLENLSWGTHEDNMDDAKKHGVHKGENNASAKITDEQALAIYLLAQLDLVNSEVISELPIGKVSVSSIKAKRMWGHVVTDDIEHLVNRCKEVQETRLADELNKQRVKLEQQHAKDIAELKKNVKLKVRHLLSEL
ncbi:hypothetical protein ACET6Z_16480 [Aeromonas veronii]|uniref:hypothetical protein n=1 Tax=Aeromonas veronii TaxID=654 RepID=UPI0028DA62D4|nr:hypothetical protein [Aeromonas veronii]